MNDTMTALEHQGISAIDHNHAGSMAMTTKLEQGTSDEGHSYSMSTSTMDPLDIAFDEERVDSLINYSVLMGFQDRDTIVCDVLQMTGGYLAACLVEQFPDWDAGKRYLTEREAEATEDNEPLGELVERRVDAALTAQAIEEASWPTTDCDRLNAAFDDLDTRGILSFQHVRGCFICGRNAVLEEAEKRQREGVEVRGIAYYDFDSTMDALLGKGVGIQYGPLREGGSHPQAIAREIIAVLRDHGLHPVCPDKYGEMIRVPLEWLRRVPLLPYGGKDFPRSYPNPDLIAWKE